RSYSPARMAPGARSTTPPATAPGTSAKPDPRRCGVPSKTPTACGTSSASPGGSDSVSPPPPTSNGSGSTLQTAPTPGHSPAALRHETGLLPYGHSCPSEGSRDLDVALGSPPWAEFSSHGRSNRYERGGANHSATAATKSSRSSSTTSDGLSELAVAAHQPR